MSDAHDARVSSASRGHGAQAVVADVRHERDVARVGRVGEGGKGLAPCLARRAECVRVRLLKLLCEERRAFGGLVSSQRLSDGAGVAPDRGGGGGIGATLAVHRERLRELVGRERRVSAHAGRIFATAATVADEQPLPPERRPTAAREAPDNAATRSTVQSRGACAARAFHRARTCAASS